MLKKLTKPLTEEITWNNEVVATLRGLNPADVTAVLVEVGKDIAAMFDVAQELQDMNIDKSNAEMLADQLLMKWPQIVGAVGVHLPHVMAMLIARAADEPDAAQQVQEDYPFPLQFEMLVVIARLTFDSPAGFKKFVGNVLMLVDLTGTLTSGNTKRPLINVAQPSLADG